LITGKLLVSRSARLTPEPLQSPIPHIRATPAEGIQSTAKMFQPFYREIQKEKAGRWGPANPGAACNSPKPLNRSQGRVTSNPLVTSVKTVQHVIASPKEREGKRDAPPLSKPPSLYWWKVPDEGAIFVEFAALGVGVLFGGGAGDSA